MKKIDWSILLGLLMIVSLSAQETKKEKQQTDFKPKNIIKIHPIDALGGAIGIGYERVIKPKTSLEIELFQDFSKRRFDSKMSERSYNLFVETDIRRYLSKRKKAPKGFFMGGGILTVYNNFNALKENNMIIKGAEELWVGIAAKTGYQWVFKKALKGFTAETNASLDYRTRLGAFDRSTKNEIGLLLRFTIGYTW